MHWLLYRILQDQHVSVNGQVMPIGHYGNGFKSGSMRLGKDALVFTKSKKTQSVGLLSQVRLVVGDPSSSSSVVCAFRVLTSLLADVPYRNQRCGGSSSHRQLGQRHRRGLTRSGFG